MLSERFQGFIDQSPISVMVRGTLERVFSAEALDQWSEHTAQQPYTRPLWFSSVYEWMNEVVFCIKPSIDAAYQGRQGQVGTSVRAVYNKLQGIELSTASALVGDSNESLRPVMGVMAARAQFLYPRVFVRSRLARGVFPHAPTSKVAL